MWQYCCWNLLVQNPNIHWASELYAKLKIAKWKEENQQEFAYLAKEPIVENPIAILKNSMNETTKPYYGFEIKPFQFFLINSSAKEFLNIFFTIFKLSLYVRICHFSTIGSFAKYANSC